MGNTQTKEEKKVNQNNNKNNNAIRKINTNNTNCKYKYNSSQSLSVSGSPVSQPTSSVSYSSDRKNYEHNKVLAYDAGASSLAPVNVLTLPNMQQRDIRDIIEKGDSEVTLSYKSVGVVLDGSDTPMGSCILLPIDRILISRHVIEGGGDVRAFKVVFGYYTGSDSCTYHVMQEIIEDSLDLDYAIIQLSSSPDRIIPMEFDNNIASESTALLHYPLGKPLQVSVNSRDNSTLAALRFMTYHDSDFGSSGGAYMNHEGKCCAIHLGCEREGNDTSHNTTRYALEIKTIYERHSNSLLFKPNGQLFSRPLLSLPFVKRGYEDEKNSSSLRRSALIANKKALEMARKESLLRTNTWKRGWMTRSVRELAEHFPKTLGISILNPSNITYSNNKIFYSNKLKTWYICYDQAGDYSTVRKFTDRFDRDNEPIFCYIALDGTESPDGKGHDFHFNNNPL